MSEAEPRQGYAISSLDEMGEGYGFRKIRHAVGVTAFGINALVLPPGYETGDMCHVEHKESVHGARDVVQTRKIKMAGIGAAAGE